MPDQLVALVWRATILGLNSIFFTIRKHLIPREVSSNGETLEIIAFGALLGTSENFFVRDHILADNFVVSALVVLG